jgi:hypothetical protein
MYLKPPETAYWGAQLEFAGLWHPHEFLATSGKAVCSAASPVNLTGEEPHLPYPCSPTWTERDDVAAMEQLIFL